MSCCSSRYGCQRHFADGPALMDYPLTSLDAQFVFLPYGSTFTNGETVRLWLESGDTRTVHVKANWPLRFADDGKVYKADQAITQDTIEQICIDNNVPYDDFIHWPQHPLHQPHDLPILLEVNQVIDQPLPWWQTLHQAFRRWLVKMRTL